jgi:hypothetical protein
MLRYAILDAGGSVISVADLSGPVDLPDYIMLSADSGVQTGDHYNRDTAEFSRPEPVLPPPAPKISEANLGRKITVNAFRARFTWPESVAFENALAISAELRVLDKRLVAVVATHVDLDDPTYSAVAMPALVSAGILTSARASAILSAPVQWKELPPSIQQSFIAAGYEIDV